ncbi:SRPBCC family protein [Flammeovirga pacifica]|uniref:Polyketide cyclase n=1 Tax=Flammeovirga pacifica TaxID=915059 RepID=A0A1S1YZ48_FLAPC|nr:hypothetical protein [Flammeovirga pacifica]OHX66145.1 hypothetical protein NH26_07170 [Flammeovirga pacifica]
MKILRFFSLGVFTALFLITGGALLLPSTYHVNQKIIIKSKADKIFPEINNLRNWDKWAFMTDNDVQRLSPTFTGPDEGVGATHSWLNYSGSKADLRILASEPFDKVVLQMTTNDGAFTSDIAFDIQSNQNGCVVTWQEKGDFGYQLAARVIAFMSDYETKIGAQYQLALEQLKFTVENGETIE